MKDSLILVAIYSIIQKEQIYEFRDLTFPNTVEVCLKMLFLSHFIEVGFKCFFVKNNYLLP